MGVVSSSIKATTDEVQQVRSQCDSNLVSMQQNRKAFRLLMRKSNFLTWNFIDISHQLKLKFMIWVIAFEEFKPN